MKPEFKKKLCRTAAGMLLAICLGASTVRAQSALPDSLIVGQWMVDSVGVVNQGSAGGAVMQKDHLVGQIYTFRAGQKFSILSKDGTESIGNYAMAVEDSVRTIGFQNRMMGISTKAVLLGLERNWLSFRIDQGPVAFVFFLHRKEISTETPLPK